MYIYKPPKENYVRTMKPLKQWLEQGIGYLKTKYKLTELEAKDIIKQGMKVSKFKVPEIKYNGRNYHGDMEEKKSNLIDYFKQIEEKKYVSAPSLTSYKSHAEEEALTGQFLNVNAQNRAKYKKLKFVAVMNKDTKAEVLYQNRQAAMKVYNNTESGMQGSTTTIFYNPTGHSSLTSTTRCVSGIGNYMSESIVGGNRYYKDFDTTLEYLVACSQVLDMKKVEKARVKYNLKTPSPKYIIEKIRQTIMLYWWHAGKFKEIEEYIYSLDDNQLCAVAYNCDLYTLREVNEEFVYKFLDKLSQRMEATPYDNYKEDIEVYESDVDIEILTKYLCSPLLIGKEVNFKRMEEQQDPTLYAITRTARNVYEVIKEHQELLDAFFFTQVLPPSLGYIKEMVRTSIVISDTDSTCCAYDEWVKWFSGNLKHTDKNMSVASSVMSLTSIFISHGLKILSKNINTSDENMERLQMKNEFYWPTFVVANVTKHYFALATISEGTVYPKPKREKKGVNLIASKSPDKIRASIDAIIDDVNDQLRANGKIEILKYVKKVVAIEEQMLEDYRNGETYMFLKDTVKHYGSYKGDPLKTKYRDFVMWNEVFEDVYGSIGQPPYVSYALPIKKSVGLLGIQQALDNHDSILGDKFRAYTIKTDLKQMNILRLPKLIIDKKGIPSIFLDLIDIKDAIYKTCHGLYIILSSLGYFTKPGVLVSDMINGTIEDVNEEEGGE